MSYEQDREDLASGEWQGFEEFPPIEELEQVERDAYAMRNQIEELLVMAEEYWENCASRLYAAKNEQYTACQWGPA